MTVTLLATEISGLATPTYNSGAVNKKYVDGTLHPSGLGNFSYISSQTMSGGSIKISKILSSFDDISIEFAPDPPEDSAINIYLDGGRVVTMISSAFALNTYGGNNKFLVNSQDGSPFFGADPETNIVSVSDPDSVIIPKGKFDECFYLSSLTISGGTLHAGDIIAVNYISAQTGVYADWISGNHTNLTGNDVAWSGAQGYWPVSSMVNDLNAWYNASSQNLSTHENDSDIHVTAGGKSEWDSAHDSGNSYTSAYISTSTGVFALEGHSHDLTTAWSGALGYWPVSSMVNTLDAWYDASAQKLSTHENLTSGNPHSVSKSDVSLGNVENTTHSTDTHTMTIDGRDVSVDGTKLDTIDTNADVTGSNPPQVHHDSHDPNDGSDALDCAAAQDLPLAGTSASEGSAHTFARSDHVHGVSHSIANNRIVTIADVDAANGQYARFTTEGLEGIADGAVLTDIGGAGVDLGNLSSVEVNTDIISDTDITDDLGSISKRWKGIYGGGISGTTISGGTIKGMVPITYSIANIRVSAQQNINIGRFKCPAGKSAYIYQANCCGSGGKGIDDLYVEMLAGASTTLTGSDSVYKTSGTELRQGNPLGSSDAADFIEIRMMYSGATAVTGIHFGTAMMQVGVY